MGYESAQPRVWPVEDPEEVAGMFCLPARTDFSRVALSIAIKVFANLRPCKFASKTMVDWSPIKREVIEGVDFMLIRENCGGAYYGNKVTKPTPLPLHRMYRT